MKLVGRSVISSSIESNKSKSHERLGHPKTRVAQSLGSYQWKCLRGLHQGRKNWLESISKSLSKIFSFLFYLWMLLLLLFSFVMLSKRGYRYYNEQNEDFSELQLTFWKL